MSQGKKRLEALRGARPGQKSWADAEALQAIDKRLQINSPDASIEVWQDAGGFHLRGKDTNRSPIRVSYSSDDEQFTIAISGMVWAARDGLGLPGMEGDAPIAQGTFAAVSWQFNKFTSPASVDIDIGYLTEPAAPTATSALNHHTAATPKLVYYCPEAAIVVDSTDQTDDLGTWHRVARVRLNADYTYSVPNDIVRPHVIYDHRGSADRSHLEHRDGVVYLWNSATSAKIASSTSDALALTLPAGDLNDYLVVGHNVTGSTTLALESDSTKEWAADSKRRVGHIIRTSGAVSLHSYTERIDYRQPGTWYWVKITSHVSGTHYRCDAWLASLGYFADDTYASARTADHTDQNLYAIQLATSPAIPNDNHYLAFVNRFGDFEFQPEIMRALP